MSELDCEGYKKLLKAVENDEAKGAWHDYRAKLQWIVDRATHYAEKAGVSAEEILDLWESRRDYWYMNYYQECNQPEIKGDRVKVFDSADHFRESVGNAGFRCPSCKGVTRSPYECDTGIAHNGSVCNWKAYGLLGHLGRGVEVLTLEDLRLHSIFKPVSWE